MTTPLVIRLAIWDLSDCISVVYTEGWEVGLVKPYFVN